MIYYNGNAYQTGNYSFEEITRMAVSRNLPWDEYIFLLDNLDGRNLKRRDDADKVIDSFLKYMHDKYDNKEED